MRVLLDENVPHALRSCLPDQETVTAAYAGLAGLKNGALLQAAIKAGFDVLVTADKTLEFEQDLAGRVLAIVLLSTNVWELMKPNVAKIATAIVSATPGSFIRVDCGLFTRRPFR